MQIDSHTYKQKNWHTQRQPDRQTDRRTGSQSERQANRQTDRKTDAHTETDCPLCSRENEMMLLGMLNMLAVFDTVDHEIFLDRLSFGIYGTALFVDTNMQE